MKRIINRALILLLCMVMLLCILPGDAEAAETSGKWENLNWSYASNTLTISGTGAMPNSVSGYTYTYPWSSYSTRITSLVVSKGVTTVGNAVFKDMTTLTSISLPSTVTTIGDHAFWRCTNLRSVTIPGSVTQIKENAFAGCTNLTTVKLGSKVETIGQSAFSGCISLTGVTFPSSVRTIDGYAFSGCSNLTSISLNEGLKTLGYRAFEKCTRLTSVKIPSTVTPPSYNAGSYIFSGCTALKTAVVNLQGKLYDGCFEGCKALTSVTIANSVTGIGQYAFMGCTSLPSITIPGSVENIYISAFHDCTSLQTVKLNEGLSYIDQQAFRNTPLKSVVIPDSVTEMGKYVFWDCKSLKTADLGEGMDEVPNSTFSGCTALESVKLGRFVSAIKSDAFINCKNLKTINWPEFLTLIEWQVFYGCSSLPSAELPEGVNTIKYNAFDGCTSLTQVSIPGTIVSVESRAFIGCKNLKTVRFGGNAPSFGSDVFRDVTADVYYPSDNGTWTASVRKQYGGTLNWIGYEEPDAPTIKVSGIGSSGKNKVSWSAVSGVAKYEIYRSTSKNSGYSRLATTAETSYIDTSGVAGTLYYYQVKSVDASGIKSDNSAPVGRTCDLARPTAKAATVASTGKIKVTWGAIDGAKEYKVYRATSKNGEYKLMKTTTATSYTNNNAEVGKKYYYAVQAIHAKSAANSVNSVSVGCTCDLARPDLSIKLKSTGKPYLTWDAIEGATGYKIYRATSKDGEYKFMKTTTATSYTNNSAESGKTYYYKIRAIHSNTSAYSAYSTVESIKAK